MCTCCPHADYITLQNVKCTTSTGIIYAQAPQITCTPVDSCSVSIFQTLDLGAAFRVLAHAFAHVVLSSSCLFPLPIHACVFIRIPSIFPLARDSSELVVMTSLQVQQEDGASKRSPVSSASVISHHQGRRKRHACRAERACTRVSVSQHACCATSNTQAVRNSHTLHHSLRGLWFPSQSDHQQRHERESRNNGERNGLAHRSLVSSTFLPVVIVGITLPKTRPP